MQKFKDNTDTEWSIELPFGEVLRINEDFAAKFTGSKIDLLEPQLDDLEKRLDDDLPFFWKVLWFVVSPQAADVLPTDAEVKRRQRDTAASPAFPGPGITAKEFGQRMAGKHLIEAQNAFFREWADFFHQLQRPDVAVSLEATLMMRQATFEKVTQKLRDCEALQSLPARTEAKIDRVLTTALLDMQASFDSTLNDSPTDSSGSDTKASPDTTEPSSSTKPTSSGCSPTETPTPPASSDTSTPVTSEPAAPK